MYKVSLKKRGDSHAIEQSEVDELFEATNVAEDMLDENDPSINAFYIVKDGEHTPTDEERYVIREKLEDAVGLVTDFEVIGLDGDDVESPLYVEVSLITTLDSDDIEAFFDPDFYDTDDYLYSIDGD